MDSSSIERRDPDPAVALQQTSGGCGFYCVQLGAPKGDNSLLEEETFSSKLVPMD